MAYAFLHIFIGGDHFPLIMLLKKEFVTHVPCDHTTWLYNIKYKHTCLILPSGHLGFFQQLPWLKISSTPWFASSLMSSYHHPMNSTSWSFWWNTCFLSRLVNPLMRIPSENLEDLVYPHLEDVSFLTWCMMSLVLDDFILSFNVQWGSQALYPSWFTTMDFVLYDSHGDVTSSCF